MAIYVLQAPARVAADTSGNVYVVGNGSDNVFQIAPGGAITEIIDTTGDGVGNALDSPSGVALALSGNVYAVGGQSNNAFEITPGGTIAEIVDATGDGTGNTRGDPNSVAVDASGNVYLAGRSSNNVFRIAGSPHLPVPSLSPLGVATLALSLAGLVGLTAKRRR